MSFSMLEIYNEDARDLLVGNSKKSALKIRQHPKKGFYGAIKTLRRRINFTDCLSVFS